MFLKNHALCRCSFSPISSIVGFMVTLIEIFKTISFTAMGAAAWALYTHWRGRTFKKKLFIDIKTKVEPTRLNKILDIEVQLKNISKVKLQARPIAFKNRVSRDQKEQIKYSCGLQIKRINTRKIAYPSNLDWYTSPSLEPIPGFPAEINLLDEYIISNESNKIIFWIEPEEVVQLNATVVLEDGHYLLKVGFYGTNPDSDYWSRQNYVHIG
jgi:hypothetical protein